jgi:hypothetical protein
MRFHRKKRTDPVEGSAFGIGNAMTERMLEMLTPEQANAVSDVLQDPEQPRTWEEAEAAGMVEEWEYVAAKGACEVCASLNGRRFDDLDALYEVLPDFGQNPQCLKGSACSCTALPGFKGST